jgi:hypothetical protein
MEVGTILLSKNNKYVDDLGNLPKRPSHDKEMLSALLSCQIVSPKGYKMLPPSLQAVCVNDPYKSPTFPVTIPEIATCKLLIVSRSAEEIAGGKVFRLNDFKCILKDRKVELWISKK